MFDDQRGTLHSLKDFPVTPREILVSVNRKNVFRGLHQSPYAKFIYVIRGSIRDLFWNDATGLSDRVLTRGQTLYIPANSAHGILALEDDSQFIYLLEGKFDPNVDRNIYWRTPEYGLPDLGPHIILSDKDRDALYANQYDYLVLGSSGYLGGHCVRHLREAGRTVLESRARLENPGDIADEIRRSGAKYVICAAGVSGRPTTEWSETHANETYKTNYLDVLNLAEVCRAADVHLTIFGSGMVFTGQKSVYSEEDEPDLYSRVYSKWRCMLEKHARGLSNVLYLRILYPCTFDDDPKCFRTKMMRRRGSVHDGQVSITSVPDLFPHIPELVEKKLTGVFNFVTDGLVTLKELAQATEVVQGTGNYGLTTDKLGAYIPLIKTKDALKNRCAYSLPEVSDS